MTATEPADLLPTRRSLLSRLKDWEQKDAWREFFNTYWRLIYDVARKAGLDDQHAQDAVQETMISVSAEMPGFRYDPKLGSFKSWLRTLTRRRIADQLRKRYARRELDHVDAAMTQIQEEIESTRDTTPALDAVWDEQWRTHMMDAALTRVKRSVKASHYQLFELTVLKACPLAEVAKSLGISLPMAYVIRHRIGRQLKKEIDSLQRNML
jgi:RNA polymerase sigma factor (sigma-70 family)